MIYPKGERPGVAPPPDEEEASRPVAIELSSPRGKRRNASGQILRGALEELIEVGAADMSLLDVATQAGVSKALIHYHFADKESLLVQLVHWTTRGILDRQSSVLRDVSPSEAVDAVWQWVARELQLGHLRAVLELSQHRSAKVQAAVHESLGYRASAMAGMIGHLFSVLELRPRVPIDLLAGVVVAFCDGLASRPSVQALTETRIAFDVFWLSLLNLAE